MIPQWRRDEVAKLLLAGCNAPVIVATLHVSLTLVSQVRTVLRKKYPGHAGLLLSMKRPRLDSQACEIEEIARRLMRAAAPMAEVCIECNITVATYRRLARGSPPETTKAKTVSATAPIVYRYLSPAELADMARHIRNGKRAQTWG